MTSVGGIAADQIKQFIERIERLDEEKSAIAEHMREVYAEAKANGYDTKILRKIIALRKKEPNERYEEQELLDLYLHALGMTGIPKLGDEAKKDASNPK